MVEPGRFRVVEGNYETYLNLVQRSGAGVMPARSVGMAGRTHGVTNLCDRPPDGARPGVAVPLRSVRARREEGRPSGPRKRRFPYRKVEDLEAEILEQETRLEQLHAALALPETHRDGDRVREVKAELAEVQEALETLYAHWEEAIELNW